MASNQAAVNDVYENLFTQLWRDSCGDYLNFGMFHEACKTLTEANDYMVDWIIRELNITKDSTLLDIGCGRGKYTVEIAKKTGCKFRGLDIVENFIATANELSEQLELGSQGEFTVGNMLQLADSLGDQQFTHVMALGCLFYVHDQMAEFLENLKPHCGDAAVLLIHDFSRNVPLEEVSDVMKHWRTTADTIETQDYLKCIKAGGFEIDLYSDDTDMGLKSCQWVVDVANRISKDTNTFTFWVLRDALQARRILHNTIIARRL